MAVRAALVLAAAFCIVMNVLLWRAEYGHTASMGSAVPPSIIFRKMLTAPDTSSLSIFQHSKKIGFCHWMTSVGEDMARLKEDTSSPEGMVGQINGYSAQLEGSLMGAESPGRVRFESHLALSANHEWQHFELTLNFHPTVVEVRVVAAEHALRLSWDDGSGKTERVIPFASLQNPTALLGGLSGIGIPQLQTPLLPQSTTTNAPPLDLTRLGLSWEGRNDELRIGHSSVRVYRLKARLLDRYEIVLYISKVGEILRVNLPNEIVLLSDQFAPPG